MKFTAGWQVSNPIAVLRHAVLQLHPIQLLQQRGAKQHHGQSRADTLTDIHRETRDVKRPCRLSVDNRQGQEHSAGVQQWADEQDTGQKAEHGHDPALLRQPALGEQKARQHSPRTVGEHLPWGIGSLPIKEVAGKGRYRAHQEARLRAKGDTRKHNDGKDRLEIGNRYGHPRGHSQSREHGNDHQLPCLRSAAFKGQQERDDDFNNDQSAGQIVGSASQPKAKVQRDRNNQQKYQERGNARFLHVAASLFFIEMNGVLRDYSTVKHMTAHAVGGGGIEAVGAEEAAGCMYPFTPSTLRLRPRRSRCRCSTRRYPAHPSACRRSSRSWGTTRPPCTSSRIPAPRQTHTGG